MNTSEVKNLERISQSIDEHNSKCEFPAVAVVLNPFEYERLDWEEIKGCKIVSDPAISTGRFRIICEGQHTEDEEEVVEAISTDREKELVYS